MPTQRNEDTNPLQPPDDETVRREINRSGSGGSGGAPEADPRVEGSGSESVDEMLAGHGPDDEATRPDEATAPADDASIARTSEPDARRTHVGWQILDRDGERLGTVVERDDASILVEPDTSTQPTARIPLRAIDEESPHDKRATLTLDAGEVADLQE